MASAAEAVALRKAEINSDIVRAREKYSKFMLNYAKTNSAYARTLRTYGLEFLHRLSKPADSDKSDVSLIQQIEKCLELDRVAINLHSKAMDEMSKDREIRFRECLKLFEERRKTYVKDFELGNDCLVRFQSAVDRKSSVPAGLLEMLLLPLRREARSKQLGLERIFLDVFEGTAIMSGRLPETTEEDAREEAL